MMFKVLDISRADEWDNLVARIPHDFYHSAGYHQLASDRGEGEPRLLVYEAAGEQVLLPLLVRPIEGSHSLVDASSVYGYSGPLCAPGVSPEVGRSFRLALTELLLELRVVSVFSRMHPLLPAQATLLNGLGSTRLVGRTVSIDLSVPPEVQRSRYRKDHKYGVNKLLRSGFVCRRDDDFASLDVFERIYSETMTRVSAAPHYFFDTAYFLRLREVLGKDLQLFVIEKGGTPAAAGLFTICNGIVQYHLSGTAGQYLKDAPMKLLVDSARLWANERDAHVLHLGGGLAATEDSLFEFKAGFSDRRHDFRLWQWIVNPQAYAALCHASATSEATAFFPAYRSPATSSPPASP